MLLEDSGKSRSPVEVDEPQFPIRPEFRDPSYAREENPLGVSYAKRYELFCRKIVRDRLYDAACLILSDRIGGVKGEFSEPAEDLSFRIFVASLLGRIAEHLRLFNTKLS